ncbi:MAG TPA: class I SAM-dependent methyltransferase [Verrucomicrobiae bacterium]|nr:class I SAM-dependent methyltransferase [Verrucomicrobiae bacterium]
MLTKQQDAYGRMVWDHLHGELTREIVERDDGRFDTSGGAPSYFAEFKDWPRHQQAAMKFVRGRVLDVGCGAGRCCLHLQKRGQKVVGIDASPLAIKTCRKRGVKNTRLLPFTQIHRGLGRFDAILMMGNNFGLFGSRRRARWLLRRLYALTSPNARIVAESLDVYRTKDPDHLQYQRFNRCRGRMSGQVRLRVRYRRYCTPWFDYLMVSPGEMKEIVADTGWHVRRFLKSDNRLYVAVIEKDGRKSRG